MTAIQSSDLELSCGLPPGPDFADLALLAEQLGYARVWIFESAPLWEDPFIHLALAATRTARIGLATAVLIPKQRSVMAMASGAAAIARLSAGRFRACFGTGGTSMWTIGQRPMSLDDLFGYVGTLRRLMDGGTATVDGRAMRMLHFRGMTADRPLGVPLWISVFGPRGHERAPEVADGIIGLPHPTLPTATMVSGTVLDPGEDALSERALQAVGPWRVLGWHSTYFRGGASAVDALPGGRAWRSELEALGPEDERHLLTFEGHVTHLAQRDLPLLRQESPGGPSRGEILGGPEEFRLELDRLAAAGFREVIYTPSGPDLPRELRAFADATRAG